METGGSAEHAERSFVDGVERRKFLLASAVLGGVGAVGGQILRPEPAAAAQARGTSALPILQPGAGRVRGAYLRATPETVTWGYLPNRASRPVLKVRSGDLVTIDTLSHEGILEDQGRDPDTYFGDLGVPRDQVL